MYKFVLMTAIFGMSMITTANASDAQGHFDYIVPDGKNIMSNSCADYVSTMRGHKTPKAFNFVAWLLGFQTAFNLATNGIKNIVPDVSKTNFPELVLHKCTLDTSQDVSQAAATVAQRLVKEILTSDPHYYSGILIKSSCPAQWVNLPKGGKVWFAGVMGADDVVDAERADIFLNINGNRISTEGDGELGLSPIYSAAVDALNCDEQN